MMLVITIVKRPFLANYKVGPLTYELVKVCH